MDFLADACCVSITIRAICEGVSIDVGIITRAVFPCWTGLCQFKMLPFCSCYSHDYLDSFDPFTVAVNRYGQVSVFRDQEVIHSNVQLPMARVYVNAVAATYVDGEPCIAVAGQGEGAGVYLRHAVTLGEVKSLPYKESVYCVCVNASGIKLFFGTESG